MREEDMPYRGTPKSTEFLVDRDTMNEAYSALAGCLAVLGNAANIGLAMEKLRDCGGNTGEQYPGHEPNFEIGGSSEPIPVALKSIDTQQEALLGLATNQELQTEMETRKELGHTHPDYRTFNYDGPVA